MRTAFGLETAADTALHAMAIRVHAFGGPDAMVLEPVALPPPAAGELLVRVHAAGVGPWDTWVRAGKSVLPQPLPLTPGSDVAGVVERVGPGVTGFGPGDAVYGTTNSRFTDGYATRAICTAAMMAHKPLGLSFIEAAGIPVVACTAWQMLFDHAQLYRGQTVLVLGAAGSVGAFVVQMAHHAGAHVIASARIDGARRLEALGADTILGPLDEPPTPLPRGVDAVIDLVGGAAQRMAMETLKPQGVLISAVSEPDAAAAERLRITARFILVNVNAQDLTRIAGQFDAGALTVRVGSVLRLDEAVTAHEMIEGKLPHPPGKIVLAID